MASCVFCASHLPSTPEGGDNLFVKSEQNVDDFSEDFIIPDPIPPTTETLFSQEELPSLPSPSALVFEGDLAIQEQLKTFFILKTVLKFPNETLCEILREENDDQSRQWSLQLCRSCELLVSQFYETFKQVSKLQRKLTRMEEELRGKIHESKDKAIDSKTGKIRSQVVLMDTIAGGIPQHDALHSDNLIQTNHFFEAETPPETGDNTNTLDIEYAFIKVECQDNQDDFNTTTVFSQDSTPEEQNQDVNSSYRTNEQVPPQFKSPLKKANEKRNAGGRRIVPWKPSVSDGSRCPKCKRELSSIKDYTNRYRHILNCGQTFKCPFCPSFYTRKDNLRTHMRKCSKIKTPSNIMIKGD